MKGIPCKSYYGSPRFSVLFLQLKSGDQQYQRRF
jgi:hypothetical protein